MYKIIILVLALCSCSDENKSQTKTIVKSESEDEKSLHFYHDFLKDFEKTLFSSTRFVKTSNDDGSWTICDKNGNYLIRGDYEFTRFDNDTLKDYKIEINRFLNNFSKKQAEFYLNIPYTLPDNRVDTFSLYFYTDDKSDLGKNKECTFNKTTYFFTYENVVSVSIDFYSESIEWYKNGTFSKFRMDPITYEYTEIK